MLKLECGLLQSAYGADSKDSILILCALKQQHTNTMQTEPHTTVIPCGQQQQHTNTMRTATAAY